MLRQNKNTAIVSLWQKSLRIAARRLCRNWLALSVTFGATSPKGRGTGVSAKPTLDERSLLYPETVVPCYQG